MINSRLDQKIEPKYFSTLSTTATAYYNVSPVKLSDIPQGDTNATRTGDRINPTEVILSANWSRGLADAIFRVIIVQFIDASDTIATTDILGYASTASNTVDSLYKFDSFVSRRFKILLDECIDVDTYHPVGYKRWHIKKMNKMIQWQPVISSTAAKNHIYMFLLSNQATGTSAVNVFYEAWVRFTDAG